jgi:hypothetical protein
LGKRRQRVEVLVVTILLINVAVLLVFFVGLAWLVIRETRRSSKRKAAAQNTEWTRETPIADLQKTSDNRKAFREWLDQLPSEEISDRRNDKEFGNYDSQSPKNSSWQVIEANRLVTARNERRALLPQWTAAIIAGVALVIAIGQLLVAVVDLS